MASALVDAINADEQPERPQTTTAVFGVLVFLASDLMLFAGFFAAYFMLRGQAPDWPPPGVSLDVLGAGAGTALLVTSSVTMHRATRAYRASSFVAARQWLVATAVLGVAFAANQLRDYLSISFSVSDHAYGGIYWTLTGLHGAHVLSGVALIGLLAWRVSTRPDAARAAFESTAYFWHLVDLVWIGLFVVIWLLR